MKIVFLGDSTQVGVSVWDGVVSVARFTPAHMVGKLLGVDITNLAVGGQTLLDALTDPYINGMNVLQYVTQSDADLFIGNWGINDAFIPGNTPTVHKARWQQLAAACGGRLIMETPNPISGTHTGILAGLVEAQRTIQGVPIIDIHRALTNWYPNWQSHLSDGVHPSSFMYAAIGTMLAENLSVG